SSNSSLIAIIIIDSIAPAKKPNKIFLGILGDDGATGSVASVIVVISSICVTLFIFSDDTSLNVLAISAAILGLESETIIFKTLVSLGDEIEIF
ncbi:hypothetical protein IR145_14090, partial [Streptococcus danieliae]|nr:hypothetical protein [Streptococcus danieliae]